MQARPEDNGKPCFLQNMVHSHLRTGSLMPTNCSSEASTSSTVISLSSGHDVSEAPCESSAQSDNSSLKEHDYIGMADILSISKPKQLMHQEKLDLEEGPDLRLGLGPSPSKGAGDSLSLPLFPQPNGENFKEAPCISHARIEGVETATHVAHVHPHSSATDSMPSSKRVDARPIPSSFHPLATDPHSKSTKRLFSDILLQPSHGVGAAYANVGAGVEDHVQKPGAIFAPGAVRSVMQRPEINSRPPGRQSQTMYYWGSPWHSEPAQNMNFCIRKDGDIPLTMKSMLHEWPSPSGGVILNNLESGPDEAPPAKEQVIGWPPVRSYRRSAINLGRSRPAGTAESDVQAAIYVKVNMDGTPIGRKVDLTAYNNYDELLSALEGMFYGPPIGEGVRFLHARDFVLTYEDKEGDWMLVGDVPWGMFVNTVKRLRITRGLDSTCLGSSTSKNVT